MTDDPKYPDIPEPKRQSKLVFVREQDPDTGDIIVVPRMTQIKFDDIAKAVFLSAYAQHGRMGDAAAAADVVPQTVRKHMETDEEFAEEFMNAEQTYRDRLVAHHQSLVFEGVKKIQYDKEGNVRSETREYPIRLIELELKKHDEGYRDKREVKHDVTGGVLFAPAAVDSAEDWESKFGSSDPASQAIDVTPTTEEDE